MKEIRKEITLNISKEKMWDLLLDDKYVCQYRGCHLRLKDDNQMEWYMNKEDNEIVLLFGEIVNRKEEEYLLVKTLNPHRGYDQDYFLEVEYNIEFFGNQTKLIIVQSGFESLPDGDKVYQENQIGWDMVVGNLKKMF